MFYGSSSGASMSLPSKNRMKRQSKTFTQVRARKLARARSASGNHDGLTESKQNGIKWMKFMNFISYVSFVAEKKWTCVKFN